MAFTERYELEDEISVVEVRLDTAPMWSCPAGEVRGRVYPVKVNGDFKLASIDDLFEAADNEPKPLVDGNFPVFIANLAGARILHAVRRGAARTKFIEAFVRLGYCSNADDAFGEPSTVLALNHTAEQHGLEVVDTLLELALYALYGLNYARPDSPQAKRRTHLLDQ